MLKSQWGNEFLNSQFSEIFQKHVYCCFASEFKQFEVLNFSCYQKLRILWSIMSL